MEAVTFPDPKVVATIHENVVPLRLPHNHQPLADQFKVKRTPHLIFLDGEGQEHHRITGFMAPEELIASLLLGNGKVFFDHEDFEIALRFLETLLRDYPKSGAAPEAIFIRGVCLYKTSHQTKPLKEAYEKLRADYPESEWTKRAFPYRLL
jgi:tetratricopeptide (TPR) repeat protein